MQTITPVFSPFYHVSHLQEHEQIKQRILPLIEQNSKVAPNNAWDWNVHSSYDQEDKLPHTINWQELIDIYAPYLQNFLTSFFKQSVQFSISGTPWYTVYEKGQNANTHEHIPDHFAVVHFLKFNPQLHWPVSFVNPNGHATKYFLNLNPQVNSKIDFNNSEQSYYHPRYTPSIIEGDLLIFPGQLEHLVEKNHSDESRVTIAFNINIV